MSRADNRYRDQVAYTTPPGDRRNEPPRDRWTLPADERCANSRTGRHDFSKFHNDDPRGSGLRSARCWYCDAYSPRSLARIAAWRAACDHKFIDSHACVKCGWTPTP
jgi:hypothetical protein